MTLAIVSCIYLSDCLSTHLSIICFISSTLCLYTHISYSLKLLRVVVIYISVNVGGGRNQTRMSTFTPAINIILNVAANLLRQGKEINGLPGGEEKKQLQFADHTIVYIEVC